MKLCCGVSQREQIRVPVAIDIAPPVDKTHYENGDEIHVEIRSQNMNNRGDRYELRSEDGGSVIKRLDNRLL